MKNPIDLLQLWLTMNITQNLKTVIGGEAALKSDLEPAMDVKTSIDFLRGTAE